MRVSIQVTLEVPKGASAQDVQQYVYGSVVGMAGGLDPKDPMFNLKAIDVQVGPVLVIRR